MFFEDDRIVAMREMILAGTRPSARAALKKLLPIQRKDFEGIFKAMDGLPVTVRLLDPPLHEFLPHEAENQAEMAKELGVDVQDDQGRVSQLHESQPDARPPRLPPRHHLSRDLEMQVTAIVEAAMQRARRRASTPPGDHDPADRYGQGADFPRSACPETIAKEEGEEVHRQARDPRSGR
jgi:pyruvate,orthophosphate dikinase